MKTLIKHSTVLTMDKEKNVYADGYILFDEEKIYGTGPCQRSEEHTSELQSQR